MSNQPYDPTKQQHYPPIGDETSLDMGNGYKIDPRKYVEDVDFTDVGSVLKTGGLLAAQVAFKTCFDALYLGIDTVPQKILTKSMDLLFPDQQAEGADAPIVVQIEGLKASDV